MAPVVVSQTQQESSVIPADSPTDLLVVACDGSMNGFDRSPTADNAVIAEMAAGFMDEDNDSNNGRACVHTRMVPINDNIGKHKTIKLTTM
jgi:hypothetical protein